MKLKQINAYSGNLLKGKRTKAVFICLMYPAVELFFRLAEAAVCCILLYAGVVSPAGLFTGECLFQQIAVAVLTVLRILTVPTLIYACAYWFVQVCSEKKHIRPLSRIILSGQIYRKSLAALLISKAVSFISLLPAVFFGASAYSIIRSGIGSAGELRLFMAVHAASLTLVSLFIWLRIKLALLTVPFLMVQFPEKNIFRLIFSAFRFVRGRCMMLFRIILHFGLPMLPVITIPLLLPHLVASLSLCIGIYIKEDEYFERNKADCQSGQTAYTAKLPYGKKRRFKTSADPSETHELGNNA